MELFLILWGEPRKRKYLIKIASVYSENKNKNKTKAKQKSCELILFGAEFKGTCNQAVKWCENN